MKNLLEELRELDNEENYEVPADFIDKVMARIKREKHSSKIKYIIPACSAAAIVLVAVVAAKNVNVSDRENEPTELYAQSVTAESEMNEEVFDSMYIADYTTTKEEMVMPEATNALKSNNKAMNIDDAYYDEIIDMLKINNIQAEKVNGVVRAKGKKEDIEVALYYFEDSIEIRQNGEYVIISEK